MSQEVKLVHYILLRRLIDILYDVQKTRKAAASRLRLMPKEFDMALPEELLKIERQVVKEIAKLLVDEPIYAEFLDKVRGVGPKLAGAIIGWIMIKFEVKPLKECSEIQKQHSQKTKDEKFLVPTLRGIGAFPKISNLWSYCGLAPDEEGRLPVRRRGTVVDWSPRMRTLMWKFGQQQVKQGAYYRKCYDEFKEGELKRHAAILENPENCPDYEECRKQIKVKKLPCRAHVDNKAKVKVKKAFLQDLWVTWRLLEGLPVTQPYSVDKLEHHPHYHPVTKALVEAKRLQPLLSPG